MPKYFREIGKQFSGDKTLAVKYMGVARSLLGGLKEMSGDLFQNTRRVVLTDGTKISVSFAGAIARVSIDVRGVGAKLSDKKKSCFAFVYTPVGGDFETKEYYSGGAPYSEYINPGVRVYPVTYDVEGNLVLAEESPTATQKCTFVKTPKKELLYSEYVELIDLESRRPSPGYTGQNELFYGGNNFFHGDDIYAVVEYSWREMFDPWERNPPVAVAYTRGYRKAEPRSSYPPNVLNRPYRDYQEPINALTVVKNGRFFAALPFAALELPGESLTGVGVFDGRLVITTLCLDGVGVGGGDEWWKEIINVFISSVPASSVDFIGSFVKIGTHNITQYADFISSPYGNVNNDVNEAFNASIGENYTFNTSGNRAVSIGKYPIGYGHTIPSTNSHGGRMYRSYIDIAIRYSLDGVKSYAAVFSYEGDDLTSHYASENLVLVDFDGNQEVWYTNDVNTIKKYVNGVVVETYTNGVLHVLDARFDISVFIPHDEDVTRIYASPGAAFSKYDFMSTDTRQYTKDAIGLTAPEFTAGFAKFKDQKDPQPLTYLNMLRDAFPGGYLHSPPTLDAYAPINFHGMGVVRIKDNT